MYRVKQRRYFVGNVGRFLANLTSNGEQWPWRCLFNSQLFSLTFLSINFKLLRNLVDYFFVKNSDFFVVENMASNGLLFSNFSSSLDLFSESCLSESMKFNPRNFSSFLKHQKPILAAGKCKCCLRCLSTAIFTL